LKDKGKIAPRITPQRIESLIVAEYSFTAAAAVGPDVPVHESLKLLTLCVIVLENGFTVTGESACVSAENFDEEIGRRVAREKAVSKIWALEGYALRERLNIAAYPERRKG
jgi:hypothetical protein